MQAVHANQCPLKGRLSAYPLLISLCKLPLLKANQNTPVSSSLQALNGGAWVGGAECVTGLEKGKVASGRQCQGRLYDELSWVWQLGAEWWDQSMGMAGDLVAMAFWSQAARCPASAEIRTDMHRHIGMHPGLGLVQGWVRSGPGHTVRLVLSSHLVISRFSKLIWQL